LCAGPRTDQTTRPRRAGESPARYPRVVRILLIGFGVVGQAFARLLREDHAQLAQRLGTEPRLVGVADSRGCAINHNGLDIAELLSAKAAGESLGRMAHVGHELPTSRMIAGTQADVLIETGPSNLRDPKPALENLLGAMRHGMHAVSVNKAPLAVAMPALLQTARFNRVQLRYSGTVGAGTPVLATARQAALGDAVVKVRAIINGTTNFILSRMAEHDEPFDVALAEAVRLGYAETDPSNDIDGVDTAMKLVILANHLRGQGTHTGGPGARTGAPDAGPSFADVQLQGIRGLDVARVREARARGQVIKLVGTIAGDGHGGTHLSVAPTEVEAGSPLDVPRNLNAVTFTLQTSGDVTLVGRGAGGPETATAIVRDLIDIYAPVRTGA
jgi:homoserine dehydrogenase